MAQPTITTAPERRTKPGLVPSLYNPAWTAGSQDREGWYAEVRITSDSGAPIDLQVSRLDGEDGWTADAAFRGSFPIFVNGYGARYLRTQRVAADIAAALDALTPNDPCPVHPDCDRMHEGGDCTDEPSDEPADEPVTWGEALGIDEGPDFYAEVHDR